MKRAEFMHTAIENNSSAGSLFPLRQLHRDDSGEQSLEVLMILAFGVLPMISAVWLMEDVIKEYVAFGQIFITSPFF
jgi:hypothetical protein